MVVDYNLSLTLPEKSHKKKPKKNADELSAEDPGDPFAGQAAPALCEFSLGVGRRDRLGPRRSGPVGIAGSERTAPSPVETRPAADPAPGGQKTIITGRLGQKGRTGAAVAAREPRSDPGLATVFRYWDKL